MSIAIGMHLLSLGKKSLTAHGHPSHLLHHAPSRFYYQFATSIFELILINFKRNLITYIYFNYF